MGLRPDRACTVYCNLIRQTFKDKPIVIGGIEASLRRLAHYDYWSDKLNRSLLLLCKIDNGQFTDIQPIRLDEMCSRLLEDRQSGDDLLR